jgi:hypothetical protein
MSTNIILTPSCTQVRLKILSTCAPKVDFPISSKVHELNKEQDKCSTISIRSPLVIIGGPDSLYHPLHQGCLKWISLGGSAKECLPRSSLQSQSSSTTTSQSHLSIQENEQNETIFIPSTIEDTILFIHPRLLHSNLTSRMSQKRHIILLNTAEDAIEKPPSIVSTSSTLLRRTTVSSTLSTNHIRNALRSLHSSDILSVKKYEREVDHDPAELFKVVNFIDEIMRIPRSLAIGMPLSSSNSIQPLVVQSRSSLTTIEGNINKFTDRDSVDSLSTTIQKQSQTPLLKQANSIVERFPIVQAFALQDVGPGGFLTMHHPIIDIGNDLVQAIRHLDPHGLKRLLRISLPALIRCWKLAIASPGSIRDPLRRLTKFSEATLAEPLSSFYEHAHVGNNDINVNEVNKNSGHLLVDICFQKGKENVLALTRGGGALFVPPITSSLPVTPTSLYQTCKIIREETMTAMKQKTLPVRKRFLRKKRSVISSSTSALSSSSISISQSKEVEAEEEKEQNNDDDNDIFSKDPTTFLLPSLYSVLEFDDAASGLRCCRTILLRTNRPPLPLSSSSVTDISAFDYSQDILLSILCDHSIKRPYYALSSGIRQGIEKSMQIASIYERNGQINEALSFIAHSVKEAIHSSFASLPNISELNMNFLSSSLFLGVDAMDASGETISSWNGDELPSLSSYISSTSTSFIAKRHIFYIKATYLIDDSSLLEHYGYEECVGIGKKSKGGGAVSFGESFVLINSSLFSQSYSSTSSIETKSANNNVDTIGLIHSSPYNQSSPSYQLHPSYIQDNIPSFTSSSSSSTTTRKIPSLQVASRILTAEIPIMNSVAVRGVCSAQAINAINTTVDEHIAYDTYLKARQQKAAREAIENEASESAIGSYGSFRGVGKGRSGGVTGGASMSSNITTNTNMNTSRNEELLSLSSSSTTTSSLSSTPLKPPPSLSLYPVIQTLGHRLPCRTFNNVNVIVSQDNLVSSSPSSPSDMTMTGLSLRLFEGGFCLNHSTRGPNVISMELHVASLHLIDGTSICSDNALLHSFPEKNSEIFKKAQSSWIDALESTTTTTHHVPQGSSSTMSTSSSSSFSSSSSTTTASIVNLSSSTNDISSETVFDIAKQYTLSSFSGYSDVIFGSSTDTTTSSTSISSSSSSSTSTSTTTDGGVSTIDIALKTPPDVLLLRLHTLSKLSELEACALGLSIVESKSELKTTSSKKEDSNDIFWMAILLPSDQTELRSNVLSLLSEWRNKLSVKDMSSSTSFSAIKEVDIKRINAGFLPISLLSSYIYLSPYLSSYSSAWEDQNLIEFAIHSDIEEYNRAESSMIVTRKEEKIIEKLVDKSSISIPVLIISGSLGGSSLAFAQAIETCLNGSPFLSSILNSTLSSTTTSTTASSSTSNQICILDCSEISLINTTEQSILQIICNKIIASKASYTLNAQEISYPSLFVLIPPSVCDLAIFSSYINQIHLPNPFVSSNTNLLSMTIIGCIFVAHLGAGAPPLTIDLRGVTPMTGLIEGLSICTELVILQAAGAGATTQSIITDTEAIQALIKRGSSSGGSSGGGGGGGGVHIPSELTFGSIAPFHSLYTSIKIPCSFAPSNRSSPFVLTLSLGTAQSIFSNAIKHWSSPKSKAFRKIHLSSLSSLSSSSSSYSSYTSSSSLPSSPSSSTSSLFYPSSVSHIYSRRQMEGSGATVGDNDEDGVGSLLRVDSYLPCSSSSSSLTLTSFCAIEEEPLRSFLTSLISGSTDRASAALLGSTGIAKLTKSVVSNSDTLFAKKEGERVAILESMPSLKIDFGIGQGIITQTASYVTGIVKLTTMTTDDVDISGENEKIHPVISSSIKQPESDSKEEIIESPLYYKLALVIASPTLGVRISPLSSSTVSTVSSSSSSISMSSNDEKIQSISTSLSLTGTGSLTDSRVSAALMTHFLSCRPSLPSLLIERERLEEREKYNCEKAHATEFLPKDITFDGVSYFNMNGVTLSGHPLSEAFCALHSSRRLALIRLWNNLQRRCEIAREREENDNGVGDPRLLFPTRDEIDRLEREEIRAINLFITNSGCNKPPDGLESYSLLLINDFGEGTIDSHTSIKQSRAWWEQLSRLKHWILERCKKAPLTISFP